MPERGSYTDETQPLGVTNKPAYNFDHSLQPELGWAPIVSAAVKIEMTMPLKPVLPLL
jgi:hypothetical protein